MSRRHPQSVALDCQAQFEFAAAAADPKKKPTFSMVAYTGAVMQLRSWMDPLIIDLAGVSFAAASLPIRRNHSADRLVGHTTSVEVKDGKLIASGIVSFETEDATAVVDAAKNGFPWQASVGASADLVEYLAPGKTAIVNGNKVTGPVEILRKSTVREISFVDLGADTATSAKVAARARGEGNREGTMNEEDQKGGANPGSAGNGTATEGAPAPGGSKGGAANTEGTPGARGVQAAGTPDDLLVSVRAENERAAKVTKMVQAAFAENPELAETAEMQALCSRATTERLSPQAVETEILKMRTRMAEQAVLRGGRPGAPAAHIRAGDDVTNDVLAAALLLSCGVSDEKLAKDRDFGQRTVDLAWKRRNLGLHGVIAAALHANGFHVEHGGQGLFESLLEASHDLRMQGRRPGRGREVHAGFSTVSLPGILGTVGNKLLLEAFTQVATTYQELAQQSDFNNFLTYKQYRLTATGGFRKVASDGELKHVSLGEETYENTLETRGMMLTLTRQQIINDDLGALQQLTRVIGRDAALALEEAVFDAFMESSDVIFTPARGNRLTASPLSLTTLQAADAALMAQTNENGKPIYAMGSKLVVPPALRALADSIYVSEKVVGSTSQPEANTMRGRMKPVSSPFLSLPALAGASGTSWYLFADPAMIPFLQVAFLQGKRQPTVETADARFDTLGISMRGFFDFGVAVVDYRGANKNTA